MLPRGPGGEKCEFLAKYLQKNGYKIQFYTVYFAKKAQKCHFWVVFDPPKNPRLCRDFYKKIVKFLKKYEIFINFMLFFVYFFKNLKIQKKVPA